MRVLGGVALITLVACVAYFPSLGGKFILDDELNLSDNQLMRAADGPYRFWLTTETLDYWPVFNTTLWLEWRLWGTNPLGYRITNLAIHIVTVLLLWALLTELSVPGAFLAALLFAVHPVNVETVAWITQIKNLLALAFSLVSAIFYLNAERQRLRARWVGLWYAASLAAFILAMLSKGSVAVVPLLLLGMVRWLRPLTRQDLLRIAPFVLVSFVLIPVNVWFQARMDTQIPSTGLVERALTAGAIVWFYLYKAVLPIDLAFIYPRWEVSAARPACWLPLLAAIAVTAILWRYRRGRGRPLLFAWGYFCVALAPVLGMSRVAFMEHSWVADHYQHLALIGVVGLVAAAWATWRGSAHGASRWAANGTAATVAVLLVSLTWHQSSLYSDEITLFTDTLRKNPHSWMAQNNLGARLYDAGRVPEAIQHLREALRLKPEYADAHNNLGNALRATGRLPEAIEHYERAAELKPGLPAAHYNLGAALSEMGDNEAAIEHYREAIRLQPWYFEARVNLGNILANSGRLDEAIGEYEAALRLHPDFAEVHYNLGVALAQAGRSAEAIAKYREALRLNGDLPHAHYRLGIALLSDQPTEAISHFRQALRLDPDYALAHNDLGVALVGIGQISEALEHFQEALRLQPDLADAKYNLEIARGLDQGGAGAVERGGGAAPARGTGP